MIRRPPVSTRTDTPFPFTTLFRSGLGGKGGRQALECLARAGIGKDCEVGVFFGRNVEHQLIMRATPQCRQQGTRYAVHSQRAFVTAPRSEEHTSELQSLVRISYAVICLKKKSNHRIKKQK